MNSFPSVKHRLLGSLCGMLLWTQLPAPAAAAEGSEYTFDTKSKPLVSAIDDFSRITGYDVVARAEYLSGKTAAAVHGKLTPEAALRRLLAGTDLQLQVTGARTIAIIAPEGDTTTDGGSQTLPPVIVEAPDGTDGVFTQDRGSVLFGATNIRETPFSINVIGEEDIVRRRSANLGDILELDPATSPTYFQNGVVPISNWGMVRGFHNNRGFIDGIPILDNDISQVEMLERVEILRGPGSFRYGFVAPGGVVSLTSKRPTEDPFTAIHTTFDNWGMLSGHLDHSGRVGKDGEFGYRVNIAGNEGGTWAGDAYTERYLLGLSLEYRISDSTTLSGNVSYSSARVDDLSWGEAFFDVNGRKLPIGPRADIGPDWVYNEAAMTRAMVRLDSKLTDDLDLVVAFGLNRGDWEYINFWPNDIEPNGDTLAGGRVVPGEHNYTYGNTTYLNYRFEHGIVKHTLTAGAMLEKSTIDWSMRAFPDVPWNIITRPRIAQPTPAPDGDYGYEIDGYQYGGFFSDQIDIGDKFHGVVGLRYTRVEETFSEPTLNQTSPKDVTNAFSWMVGALYDVTDEVGVYASVATGVEPGERAPTDASNPGELLGPIDSFQVETGVKWTLKENVATVDANFFYITRTSQFYTGPGTEFRDGGEQRHLGGELMFKGRFWKPLVLTGGLQYLHAELVDTPDPSTEGDRPIGVPKIQAVLDATLDISAVPGLYVSGTILHTGDRELDSPNSAKDAKAYTRFDVGAGYGFTVRDTDWKVFVRVENVFDKEYLIGDYAAYGAPRTVIFGVDVKF